MMAVHIAEEVQRKSEAAGRICNGIKRWPFTSSSRERESALKVEQMLLWFVAALECLAG
jgi:hypothetical protein